MLYEEDLQNTCVTSVLNIQFYLKVRSGNNVHKLGLRSSSLPNFTMLVAVGSRHPRPSAVFHPELGLITEF